MTYEEFYKEQYPVLLKAEEQLKNLITQFETNENKKKIAYCSSRIKSPESMKQKLLKKGEEPNAENAVSKVNDAVGIRVITSFVDDIYKVADLIEKQQDIHILKIKDYVHQMKYKKNIKDEIMIRSELKRCADEIASIDLSMQTIKDLIQNDEKCCK